MLGLVRVHIVIGLYDIGIGLNAIVTIHIGGVLLMVLFGVGVTGWSAVGEWWGDTGLLLKGSYGIFYRMKLPLWRTICTVVLLMVNGLAGIFLGI